jgi:anti-sigma factor RsiW
MSLCSVQASGSIELYFYDELDASERASIDQHLTTCRECRAALEEMRVISDALAARTDVSGPADGDWAPFMTRLDGALEAERALHRSGAAAFSRRTTAQYLAMAALLSLVTSSVGYVAYQRYAKPPVRIADAAPGATTPASGATGPAVVTPTTVAEASAESDRAFTALSEQHFERSKLVVLGLAAKNPQRAHPADWAYERQLASTLLSDTRLYRLAAQERGLRTLAGVMSDLELVLLQASHSDEADAETLPRLQRLIRKRDLVTKMEVVSTSGM